MSGKKHFYEVDIAKGIGILFVVIGHCFPDVSTEAGISVLSFRVIHDVIYSFHMPLMFFLAGFLAQRILYLKNVAQRLLFIKDRFIRLMVPYFVIGFFYMPVKMAMSQFAAKPFDIVNLWQIIVGENPDGGLWYLYDLFLIQAILAIVCTKKNVNYIVEISLAISALVIITQFSFYRIDDALYYLFFVALGLLIGMNYGYLKNCLSGTVVLTVVIIFFLATVGYLKFDMVGMKLICGITGSIAVFMVSLILQNQNGRGAEGLRFLGTYTMDIYVLHGIVMAAIRIALWSLLKLNYYVCTVLMLIGGLLIPIIVSELFIKRFKVMKLLFLGER